MTSSPPTESPAIGDGAIAIRRGTPDDAEACHQLLWESVTDLAERLAAPLEGSVDD